MPGVVGPELITYDEPRFVLPTPKGSVEYFSMVIRFDRERWRYVCAELHAREITTELLRYAKIADWVGMALRPGFEGRAIRELPNPDGQEPWGFTAPKALASVRTSVHWLGSHTFTVTASQCRTNRQKPSRKG